MRYLPFPPLFVDNAPSKKRDLKLKRLDSPRSRCAREVGDLTGLGRTREVEGVVSKKGVHVLQEYRRRLPGIFWTLSRAKELRDLGGLFWIDNRRSWDRILVDPYCRADSYKKENKCDEERKKEFLLCHTGFLSPKNYSSRLQTVWLYCLVTMASEELSKCGRLVSQKFFRATGFDENATVHDGHAVATTQDLRTMCHLDDRRVPEMLTQRFMHLGIYL